MSLNCVWTWTSGWKAGLEGLRRGSQVTSFWKAMDQRKDPRSVQNLWRISALKQLWSGPLSAPTLTLSGFQISRFSGFFQSNNGSKGRLCRNSSQLHWYCALYFSKLTQPDFPCCSRHKYIWIQLNTHMKLYIFLPCWSSKLFPTTKLENKLCFLKQLHLTKSKSNQIWPIALWQTPTVTVT